MNWFLDGDRNNKFFHAQVNGRRKRLQVKIIQNSGGQWLETTEDMAEEAVNFFQKHNFIKIRYLLLLVFLITYLAWWRWGRMITL